jgi:hypothetical protein
VAVIISIRSEYSVYSFTETDGRTVIEKWFDDNDIPELLWYDLFTRWDFFKNYGHNSIRSSVVDLGGGFYGLMVPRKGGPSACPIFCYGPFDKETEITFLAGARWDEKLKRVRPFSAIGTAEENLEILLEHRHRRRRG